MNVWGLVLFVYGLLLMVVGAAMVARWWFEQRVDRRAEALFDRVFAERAGIDLSHTCEPTFLGRRK